MTAWIRSAMSRSDFGISAIFASRSGSPAALSLLARSSAFSSLARSRIAPFSSAVKPLAFVSRPADGLGRLLRVTHVRFPCA